MNTSDIWGILNIEPTTSPEQIREAYLAALPGHNPEDDPKGFMELRAAYETALARARDAGEDNRDGSVSPPLLSPFDSAVNDDKDSLAIREILSDFPRRMSTQEWCRLFENAQVDGIDRQDEFSEKLLAELMDGQYLPRRIWALFDKVFSWSARAKHLKEIFPAGYIEYVLNGIRYERAVRDGFFDYERDKGEDFDAFIHFFHELSETMRSGELDKAAGLAAGAGGSLYSHPDYQLLLARLCRMREDFEGERKILDSLGEKWPDDPFVCTALGDALLESDPEEALEIYNKVLESDPEHYGAMIGGAYALLNAGALEEAKAAAYELLMEDSFDGGAMGVFNSANEKLAPVFLERLEKNPDDAEARYKLASCYYNLGKFEESLDLIVDTEPDDEHRAKHYEFYSDLFFLTSDELTDEDKDILLEYIKAWEEAETEHKRLKYLPEKYHRLGMDDIALDKAEILLAEFPGDPELCRVKAQIFRSRGDVSNAFKAIAEGLDKSPAHAALLSIEALLLEEAGNAGEAVDSANAALASFPFNHEMWELIVRCYDRVGQYGDVLSTIERAEALGFPEDTFARLKAVALYETEDPDNEAQGLFEAALENDPDDEICLEKLTVLYARGGRSKEAMQLSARLLEKHEGPYAYLLRGWLYANFPQTTDKFAKARARSDFRKALELNDRFAPAWYQLGVLAYDEGRMEEAAADFQLTLDIDPYFSDVHFYLAIAYDSTGDTENALRVLDEGIALLQDNEGDESNENKENYSRLLLKKAELLYDNHLYRELAELGEGPSKAEEDRMASAERRGELAYALYQIGEDEKAEAMFRRVFEGFNLEEAASSPIMGRIKTNYAEFLRYAKRDLAAALEFYKSANEDDENMRSMIRLARVYKAAGENHEAEKLFKKTLKAVKRLRRGDTDPCLEYMAGECYFGLNNFAKAKEHLEKAVSVSTEGRDCPQRRCFEALFSLALIALEEGELPKARDCYRQVCATVMDRDYRERASLFE